MAEELGTIKIEVQNLGGPTGGGGASSGGSSAPQPSPAPRSTEPPRAGRPKPGDDDFIGPLTRQQVAEQKTANWRSLWRLVGPRMANIVPGGGATTSLIGDAGLLASGAGGALGIAAGIGVAVAGVVALGAAAWGTVKAMVAAQRSTVELARWIGNMDPRVALANANEQVSEISRRISASAQVGQYAALGLREETALNDALTDLSIALAPIKALLGAVLYEILTAAVRAITDLVETAKVVASVFAAATRTILYAIASVSAIVAPNAFATVNAMLIGIDQKLGAIQQNTRPAMMRQANAWAIAEARSYGGRNW